jgi:4-aminobutyrate aminotransferase-like enzyme
MSISIQSLVERRERLLGPGNPLFYDDPVHLVRGEGVWLHDADGNRYLDCYNNVPCVGHCHPAVVDALCKQAGLLNTHTRYLHENILDYAERLLARFDASLDRIAIACTGSEANDLARRAVEFDF